jgi:hypothetical protein
VNWVSVGDQEERSREAIQVEDRKRTLELASQPVVKGKGNYGWIVFDKSSLLIGLKYMK